MVEQTKLCIWVYQKCDDCQIVKEHIQLKMVTVGDLCTFLDVVGQIDVVKLYKN